MQPVYVACAPNRMMLRNTGRRCPQNTDGGAAILAHCVDQGYPWWQAVPIGGFCGSRLHGNLARGGRGQRAALAIFGIILEGKVHQVPTSPIPACASTRGLVAAAPRPVSVPSGNSRSEGGFSYVGERILRASRSRCSCRVHAFLSSSSPPLLAPPSVTLRAPQPLELATRTSSDAPERRRRHVGIRRLRVRKLEPRAHRAGLLREPLLQRRRATLAIASRVRARSAVCCVSGALRVRADTGRRLAQKPDGILPFHIYEK